MKRILALLFSLVLACTACLSGWAEETPPTMPQGAPPEGFGSSDGSSMPEGFGPSDGDSMPEGFEPSDGGSSGLPEGVTPPEGGFPGGMPFGGDFSSGQKAEGQLGSWSMGGKDASSAEGDDYAYDAALFITENGVDDAKSAMGRAVSGSFDDKVMADLVLSDSVSGHNGIIVSNASYTIKNASIEMLTDADGTDTCDFSGKGAAVAAFGKDANVTLENSSVHTSGVATMPLFADDGATLTVNQSKLQSDGGTLYREYLSTPDQKLMVAPPWILGIMGNARCLNLMGNGTTVNVLDSETSAGAWAVLSTDSGSDMHLNVYNSSLTLNNADESRHPLQAEGGQISETLDNPYTVHYGSGYGSFVIGGTAETFAGTDFRVGTYATIFNGGSAIYTSIKAGEKYELRNSSDEITALYEAKEDKVTEIHSDTFGFMAMQNKNRLTIDSGTKVDSGFATFLVKTGYGGETLTASIDCAEITNGGVLIQVMDNDDATNGGMMTADDPANTNGSMQNFKPFHMETSGFNTASAAADTAQQTFVFTNGAYTGNIYNASGSDGLNGNALTLTFGQGARYSGAIASSAAIHVSYDGSMQVKENGGFAFDNAEAAAVFASQYQNTYFSINEYYSIGQVANLVNYNGANDIHVSLTDNAVWNVTGTSLISSLILADHAQVIVPEGVTLTVNGVDYTDCTLTADSL